MPSELLPHIHVLLPLLAELKICRESFVDYFFDEIVCEPQSLEFSIKVVFVYLYNTSGQRFCTLSNLLTKRNDECLISIGK